MFCAVGSGGYVAYADLMIGILCNEQGEHKQARDHLQQTLAFAQALGDPRWEAYVLLNLGATAQAGRSHDEAHRHLERSLALFEQAGDQHGTARSRHMLARLHESAALLTGPRDEPECRLSGDLRQPPKQVIITLGFVTR